MLCQFCKLSELTSRAVYKDSFFVCFPSWTPITPGHLIVVPIRHVPKITKLSQEEWSRLKPVILKVSQAVNSIFHCKGFNYAWNDGAEAGQSVPHLHFHIVPRYSDKDQVKGVNPRALLYGSYPKRPRWPNSKLSKLAARLAKKITKKG